MRGQLEADRRYLEGLSHRVTDILKHAKSASTQISDARWVPASPLGFMSLWSRFSCAWMVFTGRGDVLLWEDQ